MTGSCVFCYSSCVSFNPTKHLKFLHQKIGSKQVKLNFDVQSQENSIREKTFHTTMG